MQWMLGWKSSSGQRASGLEHAAPVASRAQIDVFAVAPTRGGVGGVVLSWSSLDLGHQRNREQRIELERRLAALLPPSIALTHVGDVLEFGVKFRR